MKSMKITVLVLAIVCTSLVMLSERRSAAQDPAKMGEQPVLAQHINQADIEAGRYKLDELLEIGEWIFAARWNKLDGACRPAARRRGSWT